MYKYNFHVIFSALLLFLNVGCSDPKTNHVPVANAGVDISVPFGEEITLDGSFSEDTDEDTLNYEWKITKKPKDSNVTLNANNIERPRFTADLVGVYSFSLVVDDGTDSSSADNVNVTVFKSGSGQIIVPSSGVQADNEIFMPASTTLYAQEMLVILLSYNDVKIKATKTVWENKMFGDTQKGELNHYYNTVSQNQFGFKAVQDAGLVSNGVVRVDFNYPHPGSSTQTDVLTATTALYNELDNALKQIVSDGFSFSPYDHDGDGQVSRNELSIVFIIAGEEEAYNNKLIKGVWAHSGCIQGGVQPDVTEKRLLDCNKNGNYVVFGENHYEAINDFHTATVGIIAHELGHGVFELPDLYFNSYSRIGQYGLMSFGSWGVASQNEKPGETPTHMTPWSKIQTGWYTAQQTHSDENTTLTLYATDDTAYNIIKIPLLNSTHEYFLLENRGTSGYDEALSMVKKQGNYVGGVAIWHIDDDVISANTESNRVNASASHKGIDLEEAAGLSNDAYESDGEPELNLYYNGNVDAFTPNSRPSTNLYNGSVTYLFVSEISTSGSQMSLKINNPSAKP